MRQSARLGDGGGLPFGGFLRGALHVGEADAVDHGDGGEDGQNPQHGSHAVGEGADDDQHDALGALHEADLAGGDERLGAGAGVADHDRGGHDEGDQHHVEEAVGAGVVDQQAEEDRHVGVAVDDGIEKRAEEGDLVGGARHAAVHHVKDAGADDDQPGIDKAARLIVVRAGKAKKQRRRHIDDQADEGQHVGRDAGEGKAVHDLVEQNSTISADGAGPGHACPIPFRSRQRRAWWSASGPPARGCLRE